MSLQTGKNASGFITGTAIFAIVAVIIVLGGVIGLMRDTILSYQGASEQIEARKLLDRAVYSVANIIGDPDNDGTFEVAVGATVAINEHFSGGNYGANAAEMYAIPKAGSYFINAAGHPLAFCAYDYGRDGNGTGGSYRTVQGQSAGGPATTDQIKRYPHFIMINPDNGSFDRSCTALYQDFINAGFDAGAFYAGLQGVVKDAVRVVTYAETLGEFNPLRRILASLGDQCLADNIVIRWNVQGTAECVEETDPSLMTLAKEALPACEGNQVLTVEEVDPPGGEPLPPGAFPDYRFTCQTVQSDFFNYSPLPGETFELRPGAAGVSSNLLYNAGGVPVVSYSMSDNLNNFSPDNNIRFIFMTVDIRQFGVIERGVSLTLRLTTTAGVQDYVIYADNQRYTSTEPYYESFRISKTLPVGSNVTGMALIADMIAGDLPGSIPIPSENQPRLLVVVDYMT